MRRPSSLSLLLTPLIALAFYNPALAAGDPGGSSAEPPKDPVLQRVAEATSKRDWIAAQGILKDAVAKAPRNADYHNLYAYSVRKGPNPDMSVVFKHYKEALAINPGHRGAHEYIGEAYLMVNDLPKAKEHLARLDKLCFFPCEEYTDLKKAVAEYEKKQAPSR